jgi:hypothetical protein
MAIHSYNEIYVALDFADKYGATSVTIETDMGEAQYSTKEALSDFEDLAPGEAFSVLNISFAEVD